MGYVKIPSKIIYGGKSFTDFYYGSGYLFQVKNSNNDSTWIMTDSFLSYELSGDNGVGTLEYDHQQYGGEPCFSGNNWKCYYCPSKEKWILTQNAPWWGYIPKTKVDVYYDTDLSAYEYDYEGDLWWESSSLNTTPVSGEVAGTFTFGIPTAYATEYGLGQYAAITCTIAGDVAGNYSTLVSGLGPCGIYDNGKYVGYPVWSYELGETNPVTNYIVKYGESKWFGIQYLNIRRIDDQYITGRWRGWVDERICGMPNLDTERGWYATANEPTVGSDFKLVFYHWVWTDPDDHEQGGSIVQESSWQDSEGNTYSRPDIDVSWDSIRNQNTVPVSRAKLLTTIDMVEAAIWR